MSPRLISPTGLLLSPSILRGVDSEAEKNTNPSMCHTAYCAVFAAPTRFICADLRAEPEPAPLLVNHKVTLLKSLVLVVAPPWFMLTRCRCQTNATRRHARGLRFSFGLICSYEVTANSLIGCPGSESCWVLLALAWLFIKGFKLHSSDIREQDGFEPVREGLTLWLTPRPPRHLFFCVCALNCPTKINALHKVFR